jgi:hypothetical protein
MLSRIWTFIKIWIIPGGLIIAFFYLLYRAFWTLATMVFYRLDNSQNSIHQAALYTPNAVLHEMGTSGYLGPVDANWKEAATPADEKPTFLGYWRGFGHAFGRIYLLPYVLISPKFYTALSRKDAGPTQKWPFETNGV